jgi:hypothetical protein
MAEHAGIRFRIGHLFPADDPVARWMTVCAMGLNDLLLVNRWLVPSLRSDGPAYINVYLSRLGASHLFEVAKFLHESERRVPEVRSFLADLGDEERAAYERVKAVGPAGMSAFAAQLEHARNQFFHYAELLPHAEDFEKLKMAMNDHAATTGEIQDGGALVEGFRALFADDIATHLSFPDADPLAAVSKISPVDLREFVPTLSAAISDYLDFAIPSLVRFIEQAPGDRCEYIESDDEPS